MISWQTIDESPADEPVVLTGLRPDPHEPSTAHPIVRMVHALYRFSSWSAAITLHLVVAIIGVGFLLGVKEAREAFVGISTGGERDRPAEDAKSPPKDDPKTPVETTPVENPVEPTKDSSPRPEIRETRPSTDPIPETETSIGGGRTWVGAYAQRGEGRGEAVRRHGGSAASEKAVGAGLEWLSRHQDKNGGWSWTNYPTHCPKDDRCDAYLQKTGSGWNQAGEYVLSPGLTGLALLCYLSAGNTHREGEYRDTVARAIAFLRATQTKDGYFLPVGYGLLYEHGVATLALAEAYGMTKDEEIRTMVARAIDAIEKSQQRFGGWNYWSPQAGEAEFTLSVWQMFALHSAKVNGFKVTPKTMELATKYLRDSITPEGKFHYRSAEKFTYNPTLGATAAGLFAAHVLGMGREAWYERGLQFIQAGTYDPGAASEGPLYFWYYKSLVLFQRQGEPWIAWNRKIQEYLLRTQTKEGHGTGSWTIVDKLIALDNAWGERLCCRTYSTAMSVLILETYYRYLPILGGDGKKPAESLPTDPIERVVRSSKEDRPKTVEELIADLKSDNSFRRWQAAKTLTERREASAFRPLLEAIDREKGDIRGVLLEYAAEWGREELLPIAVRELDSASPRVRQGAVQALTKLTGLKHGDDVAAWKKWWAGRK